MAETLHSSADVRDVDNYGTAASLLDPVAGQDGNTALNEKARLVGAALGNTVVKLRKTREILREAGSEAQEMVAARVGEIKSGAAARLTEMSEALKNKTRDWSEAAAAGAEDLSRAAVEKAGDVRSQAKIVYYRTRQQTRQLAQQYPLYVVLAGGALGFLLGVGLRIWRSNREY